ncbi:MAG: ABC transporter permease [Acidobacteria bacterium]|nr:ABC transporter permease [Acidobacteriota bacterium]
MRERIEQWWRETHGTRLELVRHFLPGMFESGLLPVVGDWTRVVSGVAAMLASSWMLLAALLIYKYGQLAQLNLHARMAAEATNDLAAITSMVLCLAMLLVAMLWQSLFPSLKDTLALAGMPVSGADLFAAKFTTLGIVFLALLAGVVVPASVVLSVATGVALGHALLVMGAACAAVFFGLLTLQGVLLQILPARAFDRAMTVMQAALFAGSIGGFSYAAWKGHGLSSLVATADSTLAAVAFSAPLAAALVYVVSYRRYARVLLESRSTAPPRRLDLLQWMLDRLVRDPREQAIFAFLWKTLQRSRVQRLALLLYVGFAMAWMGKMVVDLQMQPSTMRELERTVFTSGPLGILLFTLLGLRQLFAIPAELPAVWMFQITEREGRASWLRAVERFVVWCGVVPAVLLGTVLVAWIGGPLVALAWSVMALLSGASAFEYLFRHWRKLPFACSYLPGKRPPLVSAAMLLLLLPALFPLAYLLYWSATNPASFLVMLGLETALWMVLRRARMKTWGRQGLVFEEAPPSDVDSFGLSSEGTVLAQEQFAEEWSRYLRGGEEEPVVRPLDEGETRWSRLWSWAAAIPGDLRFAMRLMLRQPGFALSIVLTLALGLGLNAAFFTVFNAFLLRPLVVRDPGSLVSIGFQTQTRTPLHLTWREYQLFAEKTPGFAEVAASSMEGTGLDGRAAHLAMVSGNYFSMLGVGAALGRPLQPREQSLVMVLSDSAWRSRYGADPGIIGRTVLAGGVPVEVVGVAPPEFAGVNAGTVAIVPPGMVPLVSVDFWVPIEVWNRHPSLPHYPVYGIVGRLADGVAETQAAALATTHARRITSGRERYDRIHRAQAESLDIPITWTALQYSLPLLVGFGLTMLIPCANAANIMLARAVARQRELGARMAMGAGRGRIVRQLMLEGFVLSAFAGLAGLAVAVVSLRAFLRLLFSTAPPTLLFRMRMPELHIDWHVFLYMLLVAALTTMLFALGPALQATRVALSVAMRGELGAMRTPGVRNLLLVGQVSLCVMLLAIATVLLRGSSKALSVDRGYQASGVFAAANQSEADARALHAILVREPWVDSLAVMTRPLIDLDPIQVSATGTPLLDAHYTSCSAEFFRMLRIPLVQGRVFSEVEAESQAPVAVLSELAARKAFGGVDPIGRTIALQQAQREAFRMPRFREARVIGVVRDVVLKARDGGPRPVVYFATGIRTGTVFAVRGKPPQELTASRLEAALAQAPGAAHGARVVGMQETVDWDTYPQQAASWLSTLLGVVALLLTITGVYAVMAYLVSQRTKEIGIRMAIGASRVQIARFVLSYSARSAALGLAAGLTLALGVLQYAMSRVEWSVDIYDLAAYGLTAAVVVAAMLLAAAGPVRRACGLDPQVTLRAD